jgi:hypothetical protein
MAFLRIRAILADELTLAESFPKVSSSPFVPWRHFYLKPTKKFEQDEQDQRRI